MNSPFQLSQDGIYRCVAFDEKFGWQTHGFGTRLGNPPTGIALKQIHSAHVVQALTSADPVLEGDALITNRSNHRISIRTADCVPILLLDSSQRCIAAVHAGWRGTSAAIVKRTVAHLNGLFGVAPADIHAAIGPCIRSCCYEVGTEVSTQFDPLFPEWTPVEGKRKLDLPEANRRQLIAAGIAAEYIYDSGRCTACEPDLFFSYRRQPNDPGRMLASICRCS